MESGARGWSLHGLIPKKDFGETNCSICFDLMIDAVVTNCKHRFCQFCLLTWLNGPHCKAQKTCPLCRAKLTVITQLPSLNAHITNKLVQELDPEDRAEWIANEIQHKNSPVNQLSGTTLANYIQIIIPITRQLYLLFFPDKYQNRQEKEFNIIPIFLAYLCFVAFVKYCIMHLF